MVVHVVPALRQAGLGGVGFSETVLVTLEGHEVLTSLPRVLAERLAVSVKQAQAPCRYDGMRLLDRVETARTAAWLKCHPER
jgi:hypothetical protein